MKNFDPSEVRHLFPALNQNINGSAPVFFDGPGGTQVPESVMKAMNGYFLTGSSNLIVSDFFSVRNVRDINKAAREKAAAFVNARSPNEIIFGANMSTLTAHLSRSISREWNAGDEIIVTELDHYSNVSYWKQSAEDRGAKWHAVRVNPEDCTLDYKHLESLLSKKTKFVAFTMASNACGSLSDAPRIIKMAKSVGAMTYVDAVHYSPHYLPDVQKLDCDFLATSPYKFFGPHIGMVYGKTEHLTRLKPYKIEPAVATPPECWETGTQNFEARAGFCAAIDYVASIGEGNTLREKLQSSYARVAQYEQEWSRRFLERAKGHNRIRIHGITDPKRVHERTATFGITMDGHETLEISNHFAKNNITTGAGSFYGIGVTKALGLLDKGGVVRVGCVHYNTFEEMDRLFDALGQLTDYPAALRSRLISSNPNSLLPCSGVARAARRNGTGACHSGS